MFENIAAIDVGATSIKMIKVRTGINDFQVKSLSIEEIDLTNPDYRDAASSAMKKMLSEDPIKGYTVVTNLPMENAIIRNITFPFNDVEKIAEAIPFEAEENVPFRLDELAMDFQSLHSDKKDEGRVLLAAARKSAVNDHVKLLHEADIMPVQMGLESNSLFGCYRYFNRVANETILQLDMGYSKSIINIIRDGHLQYTRSCPAAMQSIHKSMADFLKVTEDKARHIFNEINIDMTALDNNIQREYYKKADLKKAQLKKIFLIVSGVLDQLVEQIMLTIGAYRMDNPDAEFSRILISGGGSNIAGLSTCISREMDIPVVPLPFLEDYKEQRIRTQFPIVLGMILAYQNSRRSNVNFLKGEFLPDITRSSRKIYYLAGAFTAGTAVILIFNILFSLIMTSRNNSHYRDLLNANYRKYFHDKDVPENAIDAARKKLIKEKKEFESMSAVISEGGSLLETLKDILSFFTKDGGFDLKNLVINESIIRIDGSAATSTGIDQFKEKLQQSGKFDSVSLNINNSRKNEVNFTITIKVKTETGAKRAN